MIHVLVWNENVHEKEMPEVAAIYPKGIHGAIADFLRCDDIEVETATLDDENCGITPERLQKSEAFLQKWGHLAIFLGRFFPFIRTFVPFIAGMGGMHWRNFVIFNVLGGITWSTLFTLLGYFFGGIPFVQEHFELLIVGIVLVSVIPTIVGLVKAKLSKK